MEKNSKIYIAGHRGMVGSAIKRNLLSAGYNNIIERTSRELDLRDQSAVQGFFAAEKPDYVFLAAAKVGGILANNTYRGEFLYDNLMIEANIIEAARVHEVKKLMFLGSSCIYPKLAPQPLTEDALLTGLLEPTNEPYAIAKITGIKLCDAYRHQYGYEGEITHDLTKPDGTPRKLMNVGKLHGMGWRHKIDLREGIQLVYSELEGEKWY